MNITSPHLQHSHGQNSPQLSGLPASADRVTRLVEVPHFTCERDQEIKRMCMERLVTPPRWVPHLPGVSLPGAVHLHVIRPLVGVAGSSIKASGCWSI